MRSKVAILLSAVAVGLAACSDRPTPTSPAGVPAPLAAISDGAHGGGNPDFFFLPPLADNPSRDPNYEPERFNAALRPVVRVFAGALDCAQATSPVYDAAASLSLPEEMYQVNWNTASSNLTPGTLYRLCAYSSSRGEPLGFLDLTPVTGGMRNVRTGDVFSFQDDRTLPIKLRIERGALCPNRISNGDCTEAPPVTTAGTTVVLPSGSAAVAIPAGAVRQGDTVSVVIDREQPSLLGPCLPGDLPQSQGCYRFHVDPADYHFAEPVRMEVCVDASTLPPEQRSLLLLYKYNDTEGLTPLPRVTPSLINCSGLAFGPSESAPTGLTAATLRTLGQWATRVLTPQPLSATVFGPASQALAGFGSSFSKLGGAVPSVPPGVVSWWPAEGNAMDLYGGNNGVLQSQSGGSTTYDPSGIIGSAFKYSGVAWVVAPDITVLDTLQRLTAEAWVKLDSVNVHDERFLTITPERVVLRHEAGDGLSRLHFYMNFGSKTSLSLQHVRVNNVLRTGCFQHVAGTYDGSAMRLYLNGQLVGENAVAGTVVLGSHEQVEINSGSAPTQGSIDEARVFNRALSADEIAAIYAAGNQNRRCGAGATQAPVQLVVPASATIGQLGLEAAASGGSGAGAYSYTSLNRAVCTVGATTGVISSLAGGTCLLMATKAGDKDYLPATSAVGSFEVYPLVTISVEERVAVADAIQVLPPIAIALEERIAVADAIQVLPPIAIALEERIAVADAIQVLPPIAITVGESILVSDAVRLLPPVVIEVSEAIRVSDAVSVY